jgi:hypothetical protein
VQHCIESVDRLLEAAFKPRISLDIPVASWFCNFILSLVYDSRYPAQNLEGALREIFSSTKSMTVFSKATEWGIKLGIPVTTTKQVTPCIFTTYNGIGTRHQETGMDDVAIRLR